MLTYRSPPDAIRLAPTIFGDTCANLMVLPTTFKGFLLVFVYLYPGNDGFTIAFYDEGLKALL